MAKHLHSSYDSLSNQTKLLAVGCVLCLHVAAGFALTNMDMSALKEPKKLKPIQVSFVEPVAKAAPVLDSAQAYTVDSTSDVAAAAITPKHAAQPAPANSTSAPKPPTNKTANHTPKTDTPKTDTSKADTPKLDTAKMNVANTQSQLSSQSHTSQVITPPSGDGSSSKNTSSSANSLVGDSTKNNADTKNNTDSKNSTNSQAGVNHGKNSNQSNEGAGNKPDSKSGNKDNGATQGGGQKPPAGADGGSNKSKNLDNVQFSADDVSWVNKPNLSYDADMYSPKSGQISVTYKVNKNGGVDSVSFSTGDKDLDRLLKKQLRQAKFKPFMHEGQAVSGTVTVSFQI